MTSMLNNIIAFWQKKPFFKAIPIFQSDRNNEVECLFVYLTEILDYQPTYIFKKC